MKGRLLGRVAGLRDVHEETVAQKALAASEARYRLLAQNANDLVLEGDNEGHIRWASESVTDTLGWSPDDLVGTAFRFLVHPDDVPKVTGVQQALLAGEAGRMRIRLRGREGRYRWFDGVVKPVFDDAGRVIGRMGGWRDAQAEQVALDAYRLIAENVGDVVALSGPDVTVLWVSPGIHAMSGWLPDDMVGHLPWEWVHPDDQATLMSGIPDLQHDRVHSVTRRARFRHRDGSYMYWSVTARKPQEPGSEEGLVVTLRNIDAEVRAEQEVEAQSVRIAAAEERYRHLVADSLDALVSADPDGCITFASPAVANILGWDPEGLVGVKVMDDLVHPDDVAGAKGARAALFIEGAGRYRARLRRPDDSYTWVEANVRIVRGSNEALVALLPCHSAMDAMTIRHRLGQVRGLEVIRQAPLPDLVVAGSV